jgi:fumarate reductase (CoM/CoB) subunit B
MVDPITDIQARCHPACRTCVNNCLLLKDLGVNGLGALELWQSGADASIPFSCAACDLCVITCTRRLNPSALMHIWRQEVAASYPDSFILNSPRQVDQPDNLYSTYRQLYPHQAPFPATQPARIAFFPGCALSAFTPDLALTAFDCLSDRYPGITWLEGCCFDPLEKLGLQSRFDTASLTLRATLQELGVQTLITACPTCYYRMSKTLPDVSVLSIYEPLRGDFRFSAPPQAPLAIHDACPDRFTQTLGKSVRLLLSGSIVTMKNEGKQTLCCGAGADVPFFNPDLGGAMRQRRLDQARANGAATLATYCTTCAVQLAANPNGLRVTHILDLLLGTEHDYNQIAERVAEIAGQNKEKVSRPA